MAERKFFVVVVCFFLFNNGSYAQHQSVEFFPSFLIKSISYQYNTRISLNNKQSQYLNTINYSLINFQCEEEKTNVFSLAPDFYSRNTGFFCQQELNFEKATAIPLRFRLGSVAYTDYLEQKPNALR